MGKILRSLNHPYTTVKTNSFLIITSHHTWTIHHNFNHRDSRETRKKKTIPKHHPSFPTPQGETRVGPSYSKASRWHQAPGPEPPQAPPTQLVTQAASAPKKSWWIYSIDGVKMIWWWIDGGWWIIHVERWAVWWFHGEPMVRTMANWWNLN